MHSPRKLPRSSPKRNCAVIPSVGSRRTLLGKVVQANIRSSLMEVSLKMEISIPRDISLETTTASLLKQAKEGRTLVNLQIPKIKPLMSLSVYPLVLYPCGLETSHAAPSPHGYPICNASGKR
ncbi:hypothetical protein GOP47_0019507 [Adiantum capillus-veneris]|uniref:Uncharacterized protein n=1 Tax=Adiantum capillus-veneris TaxID=13818 RepID=A0A9D4UBY2_ADICA|nr:hypothetical protein GOP47_0019507 [Adiantum capillus-veneris]